MPEIQENIMLAPYTTLGVGGPARYFVSVASQDDLIDAVAFASEKNLPIYLLGKSSNTLFGDDGFPGLVMQVSICGFKYSFEGENVHLVLGAGEVWDECVARAVEQGWSGIESLSGIPGSVGASPVQNIGAYGVSVQDVLESVDVFDMKDKVMRTFSKDECGLSYRSSMFKIEAGKRYCVTRVHLRLVLSSMAPVQQYHDLQSYFHGSTEDVPIRDIRSALLEIRTQKGMVFVPGADTYKSVGSFFKNPVVSPEGFARVRSTLAACPDGLCADPWFWVQKNGDVKIAAACLIERSGFPKGYSERNVGISPQHALSLINRGGASASEIVQLAQKIQDEVHTRFGVSLEREVEYVGV
ncbi:MAG: UDP-N-acetylmuramate dehydrogenase [Candidatus Uhrbacteria bacterium]|nr:UDP-N-acetylmuramate dehydrogenase [Candidatus Uhrbacteria bacterium]